MITHRLKIYPGAFRATKRGDRRHEIRENDRGYMDGHHLLLEEWDSSEEKYTGDELMVRVSHISRGPDLGLPRGLVVMSIIPIPMPIHVQGDDVASRKARVVEERRHRDGQGAEDL